MEIAYVISQVFGWLATGFRAGGMLAKDTMTVKWLVSIGNLGWMVSGILTQNIPLIVSNALCLIVMMVEIIKNKRLAKNTKTKYTKENESNLQGGKNGTQ